MKLIKIKNILFLIFVVFFFSNLSFGQRVIVDKTKGNHNYSQKAIMDGNLVETVFYNFGEIADWQNVPDKSGVWPKGTNHTYVDGVAVIVQAEATDPKGKVIHPLETNYYEYTRHDIATGVTYGWWPLPGYNNPYQNSIAKSNDPNTWPLSWPDRPPEYNGVWNGYFGLGIKNADVESYFVFDDNEDREYILKNNFHPDADDSTRGGLGTQVKGRGFQWSQVLAEDVIFWYYEITNMGTYDYNRALFAQYVDWGIGGHDNSSNNAGDYDETLDISYAWSQVNVGSPGGWSPVGLAGYAFLESPGISDDQKDNDDDGLTDERRDNLAQNYITNIDQDPYIKNAFLDSVKFHNFYGYSWKAHWDADENANWRPFLDINKNGKWDAGEPLNDDVGTDGIGPYDDNYPGPDKDGSEGDGKPEMGEPNFGFADKDESDQLGLTGFLIFPTHTPYDLDNDEQNWQGLSALPAPHGQSLVGVNLANFFSSYFIHLNGRNTYHGEIEGIGETQRFSMALIFALDKGNLFRRKKTVQQIYNANYHFAKPPEKPIIHAVAGDKKVTLYWDNRAELTFDAFYQRYNFEGYRIYRSTEPNFLEDKTITDAYGVPVFRKPLAQFDLVDGVKGLHPIDVNGALFYLGDDSGLRHSYTDTTVQNGQTYYYAVVAYDKGFVDVSVEGVTQGIPPSETSSIINIVNGKVVTDINTAAVTPHSPAAGYVDPSLNNQVHTGPGTGSFALEIIDPDSIRNDNTYKILFADSTKFHNNPHPYFSVINTTNADTLIQNSQISGNQEITKVIDGYSLQINNDTVVTVTSKSGWINGSSNYVVKLGFDSRFSAAYQSRRVNYPADFDIMFVAPGEGDTTFPATTFSQPGISNIKIKNVTEDKDKWQFVFRDENSNNIFDSGDALFLVVGDSSGKPAKSFGSANFSWSFTIEQDTSVKAVDQRPPQVGDVYRIVTTKPFRTGETFEFSSKAAVFNLAKAKNDLDKISVVPNPYVGAASWEPTTTTVGRGDRRIYFMHLPANCTIRIYTLNGKLVKELNHSSSISDGQESWNLISRDGMDIAYGVYIYHVDAPGIGTKINRFAIIK